MSDEKSFFGEWSEAIKALPLEKTPTPLQLKDVNAIYVDGMNGTIFLLYVDEDADEHVVAKFKVDPEHPMTYTEGSYGPNACYAVEIVK